MDQSPLISVIVPVYNVEQYLDGCMESLVAQTYKNLQIIMVDDGAKDNSGKLCDAWAKKDSRIQVIHQQNRGLSGARNTGIEAATGEYIMFVDSDDLLSPDLCSVLYNSLSDGDISICDLVHIFPKENWEFSICEETVCMSAEEAIQAMWYQTAFLPCACAKLFRAELFSHHRFTEKRLFEDVDLMHEVFYEANKICYNRSRLYGYVHRENSITTNAFSVRDLDILIIADKLKDFVADKPSLQDAARAYSVTAAMRVWLNAPKTDALAQGIEKAKQIIDTHGKPVLRDPHIRKKNRYALYLYFFCKPLMRFIYTFINRWS